MPEKPSSEQKRTYRLNDSNVRTPFSVCMFFESLPHVEYNGWQPQMNIGQREGIIYQL